MPLELHEPSLRHIELLFSRRKRPMPQRNRSQAMLPVGSQVVFNPHGTAPGIDLTVPNSTGGTCRIFCLPGVPAEMKEMWKAEVMPRIVESLGPHRKPIHFHTVKIFGIGESDVEARLPDLISRDRFPRVGITVSQATISLRIVAEAASAAEFESLIASTNQEIHAALGNLIFGSGEDEIQDAVCRLLAGAELRLAVLEIGPAAQCAEAMFSGSRSRPQTFAGCVAFPGVESAVKSMTTVSESLRLMQGPPDSASDPAGVYLWLAEAARCMFSADIGLAFGPYPRIDDPVQVASASDIHFAVAGDAIRSGYDLRSMGGHPDVIHSRIAKTALDIVRLKLLDVNTPI
ncbi:MAG: competence/damage-inducible protein A [Pirellulales bacterium]